MVNALATMALETLRLLISEVRFLSGVEGQVADVERDLKRMHCFLKDADKWQDRYDSAIVQALVSDLINLATRADELLETYVVEFKSRRKGKNLKEKIKRIIRKLSKIDKIHGIGKDVAAIASRMDKLTTDLESRRNGAQGSSSFERNDDQRLLRQTYGHVIEEQFVGMKNAIDILEKRMKKDDRSSRVISICGMGGLGKTTLARKIYQQKFDFEARAWVCITQKLEAKAVYQDILGQLLPGENNEGEEAELVRKLYGIQKVKKCLVVLDDIWKIDHWDILKNAFPLAESNSKILLTTRNQRIADTEFVYKLDCLTEDESWDLLQKIALPIHESEGLTIANSKQFEAVGRQLVCKCGRLPLAVSVIGGILRGNPYLGHWNRVLENMASYLRHGEGVNANDKRVEQVLSLSYDLLPYYLKLCFLYLGCFSEDKDIRVEDVYLIWMAEGLISSYDKGLNETLWDVAERYLNELASKCLVQVKLTSGKTKMESFKSCRLHDLVRDLCLSKGKEEKFFEDYQGKIQRLAINLGDDHDAQFNNANLRSLLFSSKWRNDGYDITSMWKNLLSNALLKSLKVLVLEYCRFEDKKLPDAVRKLVMLKHLSIRESEVEELPNFVCTLPCLQSMDLRARRSIKVPNSIDKMGRLKHLFLKRYETKTIDGERLRLGGLTELETLIGFSNKTCHTNDLLKLTNLRSFDGYVEDDVESLSVVVEHITTLRDQLRETSLNIYVSSEQGSHVIDSLMHCPINYLEIEGRLRRLPTWDHNLRTLDLSDSEIGEDPMTTLQHLPMLEILSLCIESFVGTKMVCGRRGFPRLKSLTLAQLENLEEWIVEEEAMPNLSDLKILACPKLTMIPQGIASMASITNLFIWGMPSNFMKRLAREGEDYNKIKHIPHAIF